LFSYLHAVVVPTGVFAASEDFGASGHDPGTGELAKRVNRAANELAALVAGPGDVPRPVAHRRTVDDEFAHPTSFEDLLRAASDGPPEY
jgi:FMN reductase